MTTTITTGSILTVGAGSILQTGAVESPNVSYDGLVLQDQNGGLGLTFDISSFPVGSLMLMCVGSTTQTDLPTANSAPPVSPQEWDIVTTNNSGVGNGHMMRILSKIKTVDESVQVIVANGSIGGFVTSYSNASNVNAYAKTDSTFNTTLSYPTPNSNPVAAGSMVVRFGFVDSGGINSFGSLSGHTKISEHSADVGQGTVLWHLDSQEGGTVNATSHSFSNYSAYGTGTTIVINN